MTNRLHQILLASLFAALASGVGGLPDSIEFEHILVNPDLGGGDCKGLADVDGDGKLDVIAGNKKDLAWYKFPDWRKTLIAPAKQEFTTDMQVADMDADGDPDMIAPDSENGEIAWFENPRPKGDPAAAPWKRHPVGSQGDWAHDVEVGDMNGDGKLDIVTRKTETLLWLQQPSGSFSKVEILAALPKGEGTALADLNRDGRLDIIQNGYWLQAPRDPANGEWRKHVIADGWPAQLGVAAADVNGDDRLDVLIGPAESHGRLAWYEAPADPVKGEWKEHVIDGDVEFLHTFQTSDMDNNGVLDIVTAEMHQSKQKRITVYFQFNQSSGPTIWHRQVIAQTGSHNLRAGDIDGDGDIDILGANWGGSHAPLEVWMNKLIDRSRMPMDSAWTYTRVDGKRAKWGDFDPPSWMKYFGLAAGNIDGRGALDVASGRYFYRSPAQGLAGPWERVTFPLNVDAMLMLDVDGDGRADVIGEALPKVYWLKPLDREGKSWKPFVIANLPPTDHVNGQGYALGQIIPGGQPEPVLAVGHAIYYLQVPPNPQAGEWPKVRVAQGTSEEGVAAADIDRDGRVDIVASAQDGKRLLWFKNPGDGSPDWKQSDIASVERFADRVAIADFNGDKRLDVAVSEETWPDVGPASVFWFEQPTAPDQPWTRHKVVTQYTTNAMDVADMNGDGVPDIITGEHRATRKLAIWQNTGHGRSWTERVVDTGKESHLGARAMDLDGDGKPEILSICWDTYWNLHLWRPASAARK